MSSQELADKLIKLISNENAEGERKNIADTGIYQDLQLGILNVVCSFNHQWADFNYETLKQFIVMYLTDQEVETIISSFNDSKVTYDWLPEKIEMAQTMIQEKLAV